MFLLLTAFGLLLSVGSVVQVIHFEIGMLVTEWILILLPALWYWRRYRIDWRSFARVKPLDTKYISTIILLAACVWAINVIITTTIGNYLAHYGYEPIEAVPYPTNVGQLIIYYLVIAFSAGVCEEILFRGAIMPSFERQGTLPAVVFCSLLFAFFHLSLINFFSIFILGMVIGLLVIKTGSLLAGVLYHIINNALAVTYMYLVVNYEQISSYLENIGVGLLIFIFICLLSGFALGLIRLQRLSGVTPVFKNRDSWLPRGWFNWVTVLIICLFILLGTVELLMGFGIING